MGCRNCDSLQDIVSLNRPYVVRTCKDCGRQVKLREPGKHGIGLEIEKGDRVVFPSEFLKIAANPLKSNGTLSRAGLSWFAELVFETELATKRNREDMPQAIRQLLDYSERYFREAESLSGLDLDDPANDEEIFKRLSNKKASIEWWGYISAMFYSMVLEAIEEGNAVGAAWAMRAGSVCLNSFALPLSGILPGLRSRCDAHLGRDAGRA